MIVAEKGYRYTVHTANKIPVFDIVFCRNYNGQFEDGITTEELLNILIDRQTKFVQDVTTQENMNVLTHLNQAKQWLSVRNYNKITRDRKHDNKRNGVHIPVKS